MKDIAEVTCCVVDAGTFPDLAKCMATKAARTLYYSAFEQEYLCVDRCVIGDGFELVQREDEFLDPDILPDIDLFLFPDIGYRGLQRHLRSLGKAVWGSMGASDFEVYRTKFIRLLEKLGLPRVKNEVIVGVHKLSDHLQTVENKWIKVNRFRADMETWHHQDYEHSRPKLRELAVRFGGVQDFITFVVQDEIETDIEIGYDGFTVDGRFPESTFQGYEKKNELYLGSLLPNDDLPEEVLEINKALAPVFEQMGYRNFFASEIRVRNGTPYLIDPTMRMAGQTQEHLLETCTNLPEVIWAGANGELVQPEFKAQFAAEATMHFTSDCEGWQVLRIAEAAKPWVKLYRYCEAGGLYHFPPHKVREAGIVIGIGDSIEASIEQVKDHFALLKGEPLEIKVDGFADLLKNIKEAEAEGVEFSDQPIPEPAIVIES